jgi:hypothetical protein
VCWAKLSVTGGARDAAKDENAVIFSRNHLADFVAIQEHIEASIIQREAQPLAAAAAVVRGFDTPARVVSPTSELASITFSESRIRQGRTRGAFGIGPLGLLVVGATMLHNKRAHRVAIIQIVTVTTVDGRSFRFTPHNPSPTGLAAIQAISQRLQTYQAGQAAARQAVSHGQPPEPSPQHGAVADELKTLAELKQSGVLTDQEFADQKQKLLET